MTEKQSDFLIFLAEKHNQLCDEMRETKEKLNEVIAKVNIMRANQETLEAELNKINKRSEENEQKN